MTEEEIRLDERRKCAAEVEAYAGTWVDSMQNRFPDGKHDDYKATGWQILMAARSLLKPKEGPSSAGGGQ